MGIIDVSHFVPERYAPDISLEPVVYRDESLYAQLVAVQIDLRNQYEKLAETIEDMQLEFPDSKKISKIKIIMNPESVQELNTANDNGFDEIAKKFDEIGRRLDSLGMMIGCLRNRLEKKRRHKIFS